MMQYNSINNEKELQRRTATVAIVVVLFIHDAVCASLLTSLSLFNLLGDPNCQNQTTLEF